MTLQEASPRVTRSAIQRLFKRNQISARTGRHWRFNLKEIEKWCSSHGSDKNLNADTLSCPPDPPRRNKPTGGGDFGLVTCSDTGCSASGGLRARLALRRSIARLRASVTNQADTDPRDASNVSASRQVCHSTSATTRSRSAGIACCASASSPSPRYAAKSYSDCSHNSAFTAFFNNFTH